MGYHAFKQGLAAWTKRKAKTNCECFICKEPVTKGTERYVNSHRFTLCSDCYIQWAEMPDTTTIGSIPRAK